MECVAGFGWAFNISLSAACFLLWDETAGRRGIALARGSRRELLQMSCLPAAVWSRRLGAAVVLLIAWGIACASASKSDQPADIAPTVRIPVASLGYVAPSPSYISLRFAMSSLDFIDKDHLLFTFRSHALMPRIPGDDPSDKDQVIHAEVLDIASGKVLQQADWRMHDRGNYLWPLNDGKFLVRQRNSLFLTDSRLELRPYLTFDTPLEAIEISPDRKLMLIEVQKMEVPSNKEPAIDPSLFGSDPGGDDAGMSVKRLKHTELVLVKPGDRTFIAESDAPHVVTLPLNDDGFMEMLQGKEANQWVLRKTYFGGKPKEFGMVRSSCVPEMQPLSETVVLTVRCPAGHMTGGKEVTAVSTDKGTLWSEMWQEKYIWPSFEYAADGSRFAYESLEVTREIGSMDSFGSEDVKGQPVGVFDTESGKLELVRDASPVLTGGTNFALSDDGRRFAIVRDGAIEVYDLPPVPTEVPTAEKKGKKK